MNDRPTIDDVARLAGVSKGTVSLAYSGRRPVSHETKQRIFEAAASLHWSASPRARALATARSGTVGLAMARRPKVLATEGFFSRFIAGCEEVLAAADIGLMLNIAPSHEAERAIYERYATGHVDGTLLLDLQDHDPRLALMNDLRLPAAALTTRSPETFDTAHLHSVHTDDTAAVHRLVDLLVAAGHRRIAHVSGPNEFTHATLRRTAFTDAMVGHGLGDALVEEGDFTAEAGRTATAHLLALEHRPTAILYANDVMAYAGLSYAQSEGLRVPDDLSITGFDDDDLSAHLSPALTTVATGAGERGAAMAHAVMRAIEGDPPTHSFLNCTDVVERGSIASPPATAHSIRGGQR